MFTLQQLYDIEARHEKEIQRFIQENKELKQTLRWILEELPHHRDWLNPDLEKLARHLVGDST